MTVSPWFWVLAGLTVCVMLFVARGMYLIGSGSDVEHEARSRVKAGGVGSQGFYLLDRLRTGHVPGVSWVENKLGWNQDDE